MFSSYNVKFTLSPRAIHLQKLQMNPIQIYLYKQPFIKLCLNKSVECSRCLRAFSILSTKQLISIETCNGFLYAEYYGFVSKHVLCYNYLLFENSVKCSWLKYVYPLDIKQCAWIKLSTRENERRDANINIWRLCTFRLLLYWIDSMLYYWPPNVIV